MIDINSINSQYNRKDFVDQYFTDVNNGLTFINANGLRIPFPNSGDIAVNVSGGADSAILSYLLLKHIQDNNLNTRVHIITFTREWRTKPWAEDGSMAVYNWLKEKFGDIIVERHGMFVPNLLEDQWKKTNTSIINYMAVELVEYICYRNGITHFYESSNRPPSELTGIAQDDNLESSRMQFNPELGRMVLRNKCDNPYHDPIPYYQYHPFLYLTKDFILALHKKYLDDELLDITRSCENKNYTEQYRNGSTIPTCNSEGLAESEKCYWCQERTYAMNNRDQYL